MSEEKPDEVRCCGTFEALIEMGFNAPFSKPIILRRDPPGMEVGDWAIALMQITDRGTIRRRKTTQIFLSYCPFCGAKLREVETAENAQGEV